MLIGGVLCQLRKVSKRWTKWCAGRVTQVKSYLGVAFRQVSRARRKLWICVLGLYFSYFGLLLSHLVIFVRKDKSVEFGPFVDCFCDPSILLFALICMLTVVVSSWTACCSLSRLLSLSVYLSAAACCTATSDSRLHRRSLGPSTSSISRTSSISETEFYEQDETAFAGSMIRWDNYTTHTHKHEMPISINWTEDVFLLSEFLHFFPWDCLLLRVFFSPQSTHVSSPHR